MRFTRKLCNFNKSKYGSMNGKQAQSAILNNILTYDYFCLRKENTATSEFNAAANYDHILPAVAVIACQLLGLAGKTAELVSYAIKFVLCTVSRLNTDQRRIFHCLDLAKFAAAPPPSGR